MAEWERHCWAHTHTHIRVPIHTYKHTCRSPEDYCQCDTGHFREDNICSFHISSHIKERCVLRKLITVSFRKSRIQTHQQDNTRQFSLQGCYMGSYLSLILVWARFFYLFIFWQTQGLCLTNCCFNCLFPTELHKMWAALAPHVSLFYAYLFILFIFTKKPKSVWCDSSEDAQVRLRQSDTNTRLAASWWTVFSSRQVNKGKKVFRQSKHKVTNSTVCFVLLPSARSCSRRGWKRHRDDKCVSGFKRRARTGWKEALRRFSRTRRIVLHGGRSPAARLQPLSASAQNSVSCKSATIDRRKKNTLKT